MKTFVLKGKAHTPAWILVDADGQTLGRLSTEIAMRLMGKDKPHYTPHMISGDVVVVINAAKIRVTGNKLLDKKYYRYSGYPGGMREMNLREKLEKNPTDVIRLSVKGMLPKNKLAADMLKNLKVFAGSDHEHTAQQPTPVELGKKTINQQNNTKTMEQDNA